MMCPLREAGGVGMQSWVVSSSFVTAAAVVLQWLFSRRLYFQMRRTTENVNRLVANCTRASAPILTTRPDFAR